MKIILPRTFTRFAENHYSPSLLLHHNHHNHHPFPNPSHSHPHQKTKQNKTNNKKKQEEETQTHTSMSLSTSNPGGIIGMVDCSHTHKKELWKDLLFRCIHTSHSVNRPRGCELTIYLTRHKKYKRRQFKRLLNVRISMHTQHTPVHKHKTAFKKKSARL